MRQGRYFAFVLCWLAAAAIPVWLAPSLVSEWVQSLPRCGDVARVCDALPFMIQFAVAAIMLVVLSTALSWLTSWRLQQTALAPFASILGWMHSMVICAEVLVGALACSNVWRMQETWPDYEMGTPWWLAAGIGLSLVVGLIPDRNTRSVAREIAAMAARR